MKIMRIAMGIVLVMVSLPAAVFAADTHEWYATAQSSGYYYMYNGSNWVGGSAPSSNDSLLFGPTPGSSKYPSNNYPVNSLFGGITFTAGGYGINGGNIFTLTGNVTNSSNDNGSGGLATNTVSNLKLGNSGITFISNGTVSSSSSAPGLQINSCDSNGYSTTFDGLGTTTASMTGAGGIVKEGAGILFMGGGYTGATLINNGTLQGNQTTLNSPITVNEDGAFVFGDTTTVPYIEGAGTVDVGNDSGKARSTGNATNRELSGEIKGLGGALVKQGSGTLKLSGASTYTGITYVDAGTLQISGSQQSAVYKVRPGGGTLFVDKSDALMSTCDVELDTLGIFEFKAEKLTIGSLSTTMMGTGQVFKISDASAVVSIGNDNSNVSFNGKIEGVAGTTIKKVGTGTWTLGGDVTGYAGQLIIDGGTVEGSTTSIPDNSMPIVNNGTLIFNQTQIASDSTQSSNISGTGSLEKKGNYTVTLEGANTYAGATTITAGTLKLGGTGGSLPDGSRLVMGSGTVFDLNGHNDIIGSLIGAGTVALGTASLTTGGDDSNSVYSGAITGSGGVTKTGSGVMTWASNAGQYTGPTNINGGTLYTNASAINDLSAVSVNEGAWWLSAGGEEVGSLAGKGNVLMINSSVTMGGNNSSTIYEGVISGSGSVTKKGAGTLTLTKNMENTQATTINGGIVALNGGGLGDTNAVTMADGTWYQLGNSDTIGSLGGGGVVSIGQDCTLFMGGNKGTTAYNGEIEGAGSLVKAGTGTMTLNGINSYTGSTIIYNGTLQINNTYASPAASDVQVYRTITDVGVLALGNTSKAVIGSLEGNGNVYLSNSSTAGITTGVNNTSTTFSGNMTGSGYLTKKGTGTMTITGSAGYSGVTTVKGGTLALSGANAKIPNSSSSEVYWGGTLQDNSTGWGIGISNNLYGGTFELNGGASGINETIGSIYTKAGTSTVKVSGTGPSTLTSKGTLMYGANASINFDVENIGSKIKLNAEPYYFSSSNGIIHFATFNSNDLATWDSVSKEVKAYSLYKTMAEATTTSNVKINASTQISGDKTINALVIDGNDEGVIITSALPSEVLTIYWSNLIANNKVEIDKQLSFVTEARVAVNGETTTKQQLNAPFGFTKAGTGTLNVQQAIQVNSDRRIAVNEGTLATQADNVITGSVIVSGGKLDVGTYTQTTKGVILKNGTIEGASNPEGFITRGLDVIPNNNYIFEVQDGVVDAVLGPHGNLEKTTDGTVTLMKHNTYAGDSGTLGTTKIVEGTLKFGINDPIAATNTLTVASGSYYATLDVGNFSARVNILTLKSTGLITGTFGTLYCNQFIDQGGHVEGVKIITGTTLLSATSRWDSQVDAGRITYEANAVLNSGSNDNTNDTTAVDLGSNGRWNLNGYDQSIGSIEGMSASKVVVGTADIEFGSNGTDTTFAGTLESPTNVGKAVKLGGGTTTLTGANSAFGGQVEVENGKIKLAEANGSFTTTTGITMNGDTSTLSLDNTVASNNNRLSDTAPITFGVTTPTTDGGTTGGGGTLEVIGGMANLVEYTGSWILNKAAHVVVSNRPGYSAELIGSSLIRNGGATGNVVANNLGVAGINAQRVKFTAAPAMVNGIIPYMTLNGNAFLKYDPTNGLTPVTPDCASIAAATNVTDNVDISSSENVGASKEIGSLIVAQNANVTGSAGAILTILKGNILMEGSNTISVPTLSFASQGVVFNDTAATISSKVSGSNGFVKSGNGNLILGSSENDYTGGTVVNAGTLTGSTNGIRGDITNFAVLKFDEATAGTYADSMSGQGTMIKTGAGTLNMTGISTCTGQTEVQQGKLVVQGVLASAVDVSAGASVGGSGSMGILSGAGSAEPGCSPGIMSVLQIDPAGGMDWSIEFTAANVNPDWDNPTASINDVVRITDLTTPFTSGFDSDNIVNVYLNVASVANTDYFLGGFYTDKNANFASSISGGLFKYFIADAGGSYSYNGQNYDLLSGYSVALSTIGAPADFGSGVVNGYVAKLLLQEGGGGDVPEPSTLLLLLPFIGFGVRRLRKRVSS